MEKLEFSNYGLEELSQKELKETDGGFWGIVGAGLLIAAGAEIIGDWDEFKDGFASAF